MKRLIIYDLDGTLVDTLEDITEAANHMLTQLKGTPLAADAVRRLVGKGLQQLVADCLKTEDPQRVAEGLKMYRAYYGQHLLDHSRLYPGAREVLEHFKERHQVVITNKPNPYSRELLTALGVAGYFREIIAGNSAYPRKPDPAAVVAVMAATHAAAPDALLVGDSPIDVETGRNAGVFTVAVTHGLADEEELARAGPDAVVRDFDELLKRAKQEGW